MIRTQFGGICATKPPVDRMYAGDALQAWLVFGLIAMVCVLLHAFDDDDK